ncbi:chorismate synthase [Salinibacter sp. 10B]|uniref:chorismate synthase n=1 Tax=Salinibacter sp. 10B TaxID=1923971 RepID=UPI000CF4CE78|nr:chorismate synthase [Salinibacter sp. 10B]PQJ35644.1 chorismate synthase [Salinibacter sp. 10B]
MLRYLTAGESHGEAIIGIIEGVPAQLPLSPDDINEHLARRWLGYGRGGRSKIENDKVHIYSGVRFSETLGSPISFRIDNGAYEKDKAGWPEKMAIEGPPPDDLEKVTLPRPGHADLAGLQKYELDDIRPVIDRSSARETAMRVACCSVARQLLNEFGIEVGSHVVSIGDVGFEEPEEWVDRRNALIEDGNGAQALYEAADESATRMLDDEMTERCVEHIDQTKKERDSLGGVYEVVVTGVPPGLGSYVHWDRRLDGQLVQAICSIQAQKAAEVGDGFFNARRRGSEVHDPIEREDGEYPRRTNHAGGTEGGTSTGMPLVVRGYMKPIPTLIKPLDSVDTATGEAQPTRYERSDVTSVPAASTVAEATVAYTVANAFLRKYGGDSIPAIRRHVEADREA